MSVKVHYIPKGYHAVTPYLVMKNAGDAIEFYKKVFSAVELFRMPAPGGKIGHAEIKIGDSHIMLADEYPDMGYKGPKTIGGSPVSIMVYVENVDSVAKKAVDLGAKPIQEIKDQFYGDRSGVFEDPFGHIWAIATHMEDVPPDELAKRAAAAHPA